LKRMTDLASFRMSEVASLEESDFNRNSPIA